MPMHFSRSLRRLEADASRRSILTFLSVALVLVLWLAWFLAAKVDVYATSNGGRLEVDRENHPVEVPVAGRVSIAPPGTGRAVKAGDVLFEVDASAERLARQELLARVAPASRQIQALRDEILSQQNARHEEGLTADATLAESAAQARESAAASESALDEARRVAALRANGIVSELESFRVGKLAEQRLNEAETDRLAAGRITQEFLARREDRVARIARLHNEIAAIEATRDAALAGAERLAYDIEQRLVRAPIGGVLAETATLKVGSMVRAGDRVCTIVPEGVLKVITSFAPAAALGRIHAGQAARVRFDGFPWTQYGATPAVVSQVAGEVRDGKVRVELTLPGVSTTVPLQHGLPAEVDVIVDRLTPLAMVLRSAGEALRVHAGNTASFPTSR